MRNWQLSQPAAKRRHVAPAVDGRAKIEPCGLDSQAADYYFSHGDEKKSCQTSNILRYISLAAEFGARKGKEVVVVVVGVAQRKSSHPDGLYVTLV